MTSWLFGPHSIDEYIQEKLDDYEDVDTVHIGLQRSEKGPMNYFATPDGWDVKLGYTEEAYRSPYLYRPAPDHLDWEEEEEMTEEALEEEKERHDRTLEAWRSKLEFEGYEVYRRDERWEKPLHIRLIESIVGSPH